MSTLVHSIDHSDAFIQHTKNYKTKQVAFPPSTYKPGCCFFMTSFPLMAVLACSPLIFLWMKGKKKGFWPLPPVCASSVMLNQAPTILPALINLLEQLTELREPVCSTVSAVTLKGYNSGAVDGRGSGVRMWGDGTELLCPLRAPLSKFSNFTNLEALQTLSSWGFST